jgi:hypothetical protein
MFRRWERSWWVSALARACGFAADASPRCARAPENKTGRTSQSGRPLTKHRKNSLR